MYLHSKILINIAQIFEIETIYSKKILYLEIIDIL